MDSLIWLKPYPDTNRIRLLADHIKFNSHLIFNFHRAAGDGNRGHPEGGLLKLCHPLVVAIRLLHSESDGMGLSMQSKIARDLPHAFPSPLDLCGMKTDFFELIAIEYFRAQHSYLDLVTFIGRAFFVQDLKLAGVY